ncbi:expressed unknown protein [Seminavis robusta]|uniref:Uncharacterized protein n=1 Tax=Seminavis robusta TaxID=568900 RepID=A0A9N8DBB5_9STRA|nr:expressed unknown protein [Seminavis robusta]|eukprot:Sro18_g013110.1 n/a (573) ;mRNA; f:152353-154071
MPWKSDKWELPEGIQSTLLGGCDSDKSVAHHLVFQLNKQCEHFRSGKSGFSACKCWDKDAVVPEETVQWFSVYQRTTKPGRHLLLQRVKDDMDQFLKQTGRERISAKVQIPGMPHHICLPKLCVLLDNELSCKKIQNGPTSKNWEKVLDTIPNAEDPATVPWCRPFDKIAKRNHKPNTELKAHEKGLPEAAFKPLILRLNHKNGYITVRKSMERRKQKRAQQQPAEMQQQPQQPANKRAKSSPEFPPIHDYDNDQHINIDVLEKIHQKLKGESVSHQRTTIKALLGHGGGDNNNGKKPHESFLWSTKNDLLQDVVEDTYKELGKRVNFVYHAITSKNCLLSEDQKKEWKKMIEKCKTEPDFLKKNYEAILDQKNKDYYNHVIAGQHPFEGCFGAAAHHQQREGQFDLTYYPAHMEESVDGIVMFWSMQETIPPNQQTKSYTLVAIPDEAKEPFFDTTESYASYVRYKKSLSEKEQQQVQEVEFEFISTLNTYDQKHPNEHRCYRIMVYELVGGTRLVFAAGKYPQTTIIPGRGKSAGAQENDSVKAALNTFPRSMLVMHQLELSSSSPQSRT